MTRKSLDQIEKEAWNPGKSLLDEPVIRVDLESGVWKGIEGRTAKEQSLDGTWIMAMGKEGDTPESVAWESGLPAEVPGSVHTALFSNGVIPDPLFGLNDKTAREYSYREWWFKKEFTAVPEKEKGEIIFDGVCYRAHVWLNDVFLGSHSGMFGRFSFPTDGILAQKNDLIVKIDNAPARPCPLSDFMDNDEGWHDGVVINCVYGWHYACLPSRGIWRHVRRSLGRETVSFEDIFVTSTDPENGVADICTAVRQGEGRGTIYADIRRKGADTGYRFSRDVCLKRGDRLHFQAAIPDPELWWPNDMGEQPLYELNWLFVPEEGNGYSYRTVFGLRKIEMAPLPGGPREDKHNWTYVLNGKPMFVKGANWCTLDVLLRFPRGRYERFLRLAARQHIQLLRAWGGGMPETDEFYDLCDELGIMVMQEWPTCWDSQKQQPYGELEDTVLTHMPRLRNHPSLIMWCGGNESREADGEAMDMMARLAYELDGSRCFHRTSPWGGGLHNYSTYWDMQDFDVSLQLKSHFMGEFGMASFPNTESVMRYLPEEERSVWPPDKYGSFAHHTPRFNQFDPCDMDYLMKHAVEFAAPDTMEDLVWATQVAQATGIRHTLESYRSRYPESTAICYYKLTDVYPAASWSSVDYYGVPKLSYYFIADSYEPLHAALLFRSVRAENGLNVPVWLFDDARRLDGAVWKIEVTAWNRSLQEIKTESYHGRSATGTNSRIGDFTLTQDRTDGSLLLFTVSLSVSGEPVHRTFYWLNFRKEQGALRKLPRARLQAETGNNTLLISNPSAFPAVGVSVENPGCAECFETEDSMFWLNPGETREIAVSETAGCRIRAWNSDGEIFT